MKLHNNDDDNDNSSSSSSAAAIGLPRRGTGWDTVVDGNTGDFSRKSGFSSLIG